MTSKPKIYIGIEPVKPDQNTFNHCHVELKVKQSDKNKHFQICTHGFLVSSVPYLFRKRFC